MNKEYTEKDWEYEMSSNFYCGKHWAAGSCSLPCPQCKTLGFYGPRKSESEGKITRKYRACKFCGFWQEAWGDVLDERGGEPYRCIAVYCENCRIYDWRVPWAREFGSCPNCHTDLKEIKWAIDDPNHPFHKLKEQMDKEHQNL